MGRGRFEAEKRGKGACEAEQGGNTERDADNTTESKATETNRERQRCGVWVDGASGLERALLRPGYAGECRHLLALGTAAGQSNSAGLLVCSLARFAVEPGHALACS